MKLGKKTLTTVAEMICGSAGGASFQWLNFPYRSSTYLSEFFDACGLPYSHDGSTRKYWVLGVLQSLNDEPAPSPALPSESLTRVLAELMDATNFPADGATRKLALADLNSAIARDSLEMYIDPSNRCGLRSTASGVAAVALPSATLKWTREELERRDAVSAYLESSSEDDFIEHVLVPVFAQLGFVRITTAGHRDKALEYGKDLWMKLRLPTGHWIYFGVQAKRDKLDSAGSSKNNVSEMLNQVRMMLGHPVFDTDVNRKCLVDHVYVACAGDITKQARNWLIENLDDAQRRHIIFLDRNELLDLVVSLNLRLPIDRTPIDDDSTIPF